MKITLTQKSLLMALTIVLLFTGSFFLRWGYINNTEFIQPVRADARNYLMLALNLARNGVYSSRDFPQVESTSEKWPPGYPFFLALIVKGSSSFDFFYRTTLLMQCLLGSMTVLLSFTLARFFMPFMWSAGTAILVMFSPHMIVMSAYLLTETLFTFTVLLALVLIAASIKVGKTWLYLLSGLTLGASILIRPVIALFPIVCAFIYLVRGGWKVREKLVATLAFLVLSISFQTGWLLWKSKELEGKPPPANEIKNQLLIGSYPDLTHKNPALRGMPYRDDPNFKNIWRKGYPAIGKHILNKFRNDPITYIKWYLYKPALFWSWKVMFSDGINFYAVKTTWFDSNFLLKIVRKIYTSLHFIPVILAFTGPFIFLLPANRKTFSEDFPTKAYLCCYSLLILFTAMFTLLAPMPRYAIPLGPIMYTLAIFTSWNMWTLFKGRKVGITA